MKKKIAILGLGGQGVLFAGKILAHSAALAGYKSTYIPNYGKEIKNGRVKSEIIISDEEIYTPFIDKADYTLVFHKFRTEEAKNLSDSSAMVFFKDFHQALDLKTFVVEAEKINEKNKSPLAENMSMIGALLSQIKDINIDDKSVSEALKQELIHKPYSLVNMNFKAYKQGRELDL